MSAAIHHPVADAWLLAAVVITCWLGALGMWRMREPTQALHYMSLPASLGIVPLTVAVFLELGASSQIAWKTLLISLVLFSINAVGTHAAARAFRARALGHWEPRDGDPIEWVRDRPADAARADAVGEEAR